MSKIEKLPSGSYRIRVYNKYTKERKSFISASKQEVKALADEYERSISPDHLYDCTIREAVSRYVENRSSVLSPSTLTSYKKILKNNLKGIEEYRVSSVTSEQIQRFVNDLSVNHSPKTVRNVYGLVISSIHAISPNKSINITLPQKKPIERHIPTDNDIQDLLSYAKGDLRKAILLASVGTLRRGECCALKYEDIQGNVIHVHADMIQTPDGGWVYKNIPKTSASDRFIEFPRKVIKELGKGEGYVIQSNPNSLTKAFERLREKLGLSCRFHDLRHYAVSIMHSIGIPDQYIQERGGYSSDLVLKSVYRHTMTTKSKEFSRKANKYMNKIV